MLSLFYRKSKQKPDPAGPSQELINTILEMKKRNPRFGCRRIAIQISNMFGININKNIVWRILFKHYKPSPNHDGQSWLSFLGCTKDSLWSLDLCRCESILLKTHWGMVLMDQYTRRTIGFVTHAGNLGGIAVCCMFNNIISTEKLPKYLSSDNDPLFTFHRWCANLERPSMARFKQIVSHEADHRWTFHFTE